MASTDPLRNNRFLAEWLFLFVILLLLGGDMGHSQYQNRRQIETHERERLASQTAVVEQLVPQILATRRAMDSILEGLPSWKRKRETARNWPTSGSVFLAMSWPEYATS